MAKTNENIFAKSAQKREHEQEVIKKSVGAIDPDEFDADRATMNISLPKSVKVGLKVYAAKHGTSVSGLIEKWFHENCVEA